MKTYKEYYEDLEIRMGFLKEDLESEFVNCESKVAIERYIEELEDQCYALKYFEKQGKNFNNVWETL